MPLTDALGYSKDPGTSLIVLLRRPERVTRPGASFVVSKDAFGDPANPGTSLVALRGRPGHVGRHGASAIGSKESLGYYEDPFFRTITRKTQ